MGPPTLTEKNNLRKRRTTEQCVHAGGPELTVGCKQPRLRDAHAYHFICRRSLVMSVWTHPMRILDFIGSSLNQQSPSFSASKTPDCPLDSHPKLAWEVPRNSAKARIWNIVILELTKWRSITVPCSWWLAHIFQWRETWQFYAIFTFWNWPKWQLSGKKQHLRECIAVGYPVLRPILSQSRPVGCFTTNVQVLQQRKDLLCVYRMNVGQQLSSTGLVSR